MQQHLRSTTIGRKLTVNPWLLLAMLPSAAILMLHLAVGPFGHPTLLHWHRHWKKLPSVLHYFVLGLAVFALILGTSQLLGLWGTPLEP